VAGDGPLQLGGVTISDNVGNFAIAEPGVAQPGTYLVFARSAEALGPGAEADYIYGDALQLSNEEDTVTLTIFGQTIDAVAYGSDEFNLVPGSSIQLDGSAAPDARDNADAASWCPGQFDFGTGDNGSPGVANRVCAQ